MPASDAHARARNRDRRARPATQRCDSTVVVRIEAVGSPELFARRGSWPVTTSPPVMTIQSRCRSAAEPASCTRRAIRMRARSRTRAHARASCRSCLVDPQQVRRIVGVHPVKHLHEQRILEQQRRRGVSMVRPHVRSPSEDREPTAHCRRSRTPSDIRCRKYPDGLPVSHRRRRRHLLLQDRRLLGETGVFQITDRLLRSMPSSATVSPSPTSGRLVPPDDRRRAGGRASPASR